MFTGGVLNQTALAENGLPRLTGSFAYAMFMANAAVSILLHCWLFEWRVLMSYQIGALVMHCFLFWGGDIVRAYKSAKAGRYDDRHHAHMAKHYKETPWLWYIVVLVVSFVIGLVVVIKENITLPVWAYIVSLLLGIFIAPLVSYRHSMPPSLHSQEAISNLNSTEHSALLSVRQRHCHKQLVKDVGGPDVTWPTHWKHVFRRM